MNIPLVANAELSPEVLGTLLIVQHFTFEDRYDFLVALAHSDHFIFHCPVWKDEGNVIRKAMGGQHA